MKPAVIVVDMLEDFVRPDGPLPVGEAGQLIIPNIQKLLLACRQKSIPIAYANDALKPDDFMFTGKMKPHGIKATPGARVIKELSPEPSDIIVPKPRFSAFFKTDLENTLNRMGIDTLVICGVATEICVLTTAYDAISSEFKVIVLEDCCASSSRRIHDQVIQMLKRGPLNPLLRVMTLADFLPTI